MPSLLTPLSEKCPKTLAILKTWGPWLLILWPVVTLFFLVRDYGLNAPFLDDLMHMDLLEKAKNTGLGWHDFFSAQMEHRIAFTRAVMVLIYELRPQSY